MCKSLKEAPYISALKDRVLRRFSIMKNTTLSISDPCSCKYCSTPLEHPVFRETLTKAYGVFQRFREQVKRGDFRAGNCTILFRGTDV